MTLFYLCTIPTLRSLLLCTIFISSTGMAASIIRGPYLQNLTDTSVVIKYRTDTPTVTHVTAEAIGALGNSQASNPMMTTEHQITLPLSIPSQDYTYEILDENGTAIASGAEYTVRSAPTPGAVGAYRIWAIGDAGTANTDAFNVYNAYHSNFDDRHTDVWLMLGDNAYVDGTDAQYQNAVFDMYSGKLPNTGFWSTRGNHERDASVYYDVHEHPTTAEGGGVPSGTEAYYSFDYGHVHFVCLDSYDTDRSIGSDMALWLEADLQATSAEFIIAYFHHPPYTKGSHDSDNWNDSTGRMHEMRERFLPILESYGCDLVLSGHSHSYERTYYLKGHYGTSDTFDPEANIYNGGDGDPVGNGAYSTLNGEGTVYITAGNSGKVTGTLTRHEAVYAPIHELGSLVIDVSNQVMQVRLLDEQARIRDEFIIRHDVDELPVVDNDAPIQVHPSDTRIAFDLSHVISNHVASNVTDATGVVLYYGLSDEGMQLDAWAHAVVVGSYTSDQQQAVANLSGLNDETTYFYRLVAQNADGSSWSPATQSWTTDSSTLPNVEFVSTAYAVDDQLITAAAIWTFDDDDNVDADWRETDYDDSGWTSGPAQLGYGDGDENTEVGFGPNDKKKYITTWFRHAFEVVDPTVYKEMNVSLLRDDAAVVYLNGIEIVRENLPSGTIDKSTLSTATVGGAEEDTFFDFSISPAELVAGKNVIAVEIHQRNKTSSDISFDLALQAEGSVPGTPIQMTNITHNSASGVADILGTGGSATSLIFFYGSTDGGTSAGAWESQISVPVSTLGEFPFLLGGLQPDTKYYVRLAGENTFGMDWSQDTLTFMTEPDPGGAGGNGGTSSDTDGDGLDDGWEVLYFGDLTSTDGLGDADADGQIDGGEFYAGTDPTNPVSALHLDLDCSLDGLDHYLSWTNHPGLLVDIQNCPDLNNTNGWAALITDVPNGTYTNTIIPGVRVFYRLSVDFP